MYLLLATIAAATSFLATPLVIRWASARGLYCVPDERRIHKAPIPRLGGVAIVVGATVGLGSAVLVTLKLQQDLGLHVPDLRVIVGLVVGGGIAFAAGLIDDLRGLRPAVKLAAQVAAALLVFWLGFRIDHLTWGGAEVELGWVALPLTVLWIVGVTNAYNLVDGMDGLAAGMGIVAFHVTAIVAVMLGNVEVALVAVVVLGALAGFLPHNFHPARIFMGDSGSLFVGFVLAVLSVQGSIKGPTAVLVFVPLFALAIPLLDTLVAIARRWLRGLPISAPDARHIHHRLVAIGLSHRNAVLVLYTVAVGFATLAILLAFAGSEGVAVVTGIGAIASTGVLVVGMRHLGYDEFLLAGKVLAAGPRRARRAVRDRILASDLASSIDRAASSEEVEALLAEGARKLGLLQMELCGPAGPRTGIRPVGGDAWTMDFPVHVCACGQDPIVLRLSAHVSDDVFPGTAERVAHIVGDALRGRLHIVNGGQGCCCDAVPDNEIASSRLKAAS
jgi:UDP-GlcNAc:undecaprenyl-phosphate/decaprenyl-phosphate GlcNAc-1-phosphate transferase